MRSKLTAASLAIGTALLLATAPARAEVNIHVDIGNAPPPPRIVFREEPHMVYVPDSRVYVVEQPNWDYDTFHYGVYWYVCNDGFWYRSRSYRGPFVVIREEVVPTAIWRVPAQRWHHQPPGLARHRGEVMVAGDRRNVTVIREKPGHGRGNGHGRGHDGD